MATRTNAITTWSEFIDKWGRGMVGEFEGEARTSNRCYPYSTLNNAMDECVIETMSVEESLGFTITGVYGQNQLVKYSDIVPLYLMGTPSEESYFLPATATTATIVLNVTDGNSGYTINTPEGVSVVSTTAEGTTTDGDSIYYVTLSLPENTGTEPEDFYIPVCTNANQNVSVDVVFGREAEPTIIFDTNNCSTNPGAGGTYTVHYTANTDFTLTDFADWVSYSPTGLTAGEGSFTVTINATTASFRTFTNGSGTTQTGTLETSDTIKIFKRTSTGYNIGRIYWFFIYNKYDEPVRYFVPAKRKSDSVCGLLDLVGDTFYTSQTSTGFTATSLHFDYGDYEIYDYIETASRGAWIDTGVIPEMDYTYKLGFAVGERVSGNVIIGLGTDSNVFRFYTANAITSFALNGTVLQPSVTTNANTLYSYQFGNHYITQLAYGFDNHAIVANGVGNTAHNYVIAGRRTTNCPLGEIRGLALRHYIIFNQCPNTNTNSMYASSGMIANLTVDGVSSAVTRSATSNLAQRGSGCTWASASTTPYDWRMAIPLGKTMTVGFSNFKGYNSYTYWVSGATVAVYGVTHIDHTTNSDVSSAWNEIDGGAGVYLGQATVTGNATSSSPASISLSFNTNALDGLENLDIVFVFGDNSVLPTGEKIYVRTGSTGTYGTNVIANVGSAATSVTLTVSANTTATVSENISWLSINKTSVSNGGTVTVTVNANSTIGNGSRSGSITFTTPAGSKAIATILQKAAPSGAVYIKTGSTSYSTSRSASFSYEESSTTVTVSANTSVSVSKSADWITLNKASTTNGGTVVVTVSSNAGSEESRTGTVTFTTTDGHTATLTITQSGLIMYEVYIKTGSTTYDTTLYSSVGSGSSSVTVTVSANTSVSVAEYPSWVTPNTTSASNGSTVTLTIAAQSAGSPERTGDVIFLGADGGDAALNITQASGYTVVVVDYANYTSGSYTLYWNTDSSDSNRPRTTINVSANINNWYIAFPSGIWVEGNGTFNGDNSRYTSSGNDTLSIYTSVWGASRVRTNGEVLYLDLYNSSGTLMDQATLNVSITPYIAIDSATKVAGASSTATTFTITSNVYWCITGKSGSGTNTSPAVNVLQEQGGGTVTVTYSANGTGTSSDSHTFTAMTSAYTTSSASVTGTVNHSGGATASYLRWRLADHEGGTYTNLGTTSISVNGYAPYVETLTNEAVWFILESNVSFQVRSITNDDSIIGVAEGDGAGGYGDISSTLTLAAGTHLVAFFSCDCMDDMPDEYFQMNAQAKLTSTSSWTTIGTWYAECEVISPDESSISIYGVGDYTEYAYVVYNGEEYMTGQGGATCAYNAQQIAVAINYTDTFGVFNGTLTSNLAIFGGEPDYEITEGSEEIYLTIPLNTGSGRYIVIYAQLNDGTSMEIGSIFQTATPAVKISHSSSTGYNSTLTKTVDSGSSSFTVYVSANTSVSITKSSWITTNVSSLSSGKRNITVTVSENTGSQREGWVRFAVNGGITATLTITQNAGQTTPTYRTVNITIESMHMMNPPQASLLAQATASYGGTPSYSVYTIPGTISGSNGYSQTIYAHIIFERDTDGVPDNNNAFSYDNGIWYTDPEPIISTSSTMSNYYSVFVDDVYILNLTDTTAPAGSNVTYQTYFSDTYVHTTGSTVVATTSDTSVILTPQFNGDEIIHRYIMVSSTTTTYPFTKFPTSVSRYKDGYQVFESTNVGVTNSGSMCAVKFSGFSSFSIYIMSSGESGYDYISVSSAVTMNQPASSYASCSNTTYCTKGSPSTTTWKQVTYNGLTEGSTYTIYVWYRKDGSTDSGADKGWFYLPYMNGIDDTTYEISLASSSSGGESTYHSVDFALDYNAGSYDGIYFVYSGDSQNPASATTVMEDYSNKGTVIWTDVAYTGTSFTFTLQLSRVDINGDNIGGVYGASVTATHNGTSYSETANGDDEVTFTIPNTPTGTITIYVN